MTTSHQTPTDTPERSVRAALFSRIAAAVPAGAIAWRQDGRPVQRDGRYFARFVCYIGANTVRERLDSVVPGEWTLELTLLPPRVTGDGEEDESCALKARLTILGIAREDVGVGRDYKAAATDAFKRAATRFGIGHELYEMEQLWVQVDGDGKYAKPLEDPAAAYARKFGGASTPAAGEPRRPPSASGSSASAPDASAPSPAITGGPATPDEPPCPKCGGRMWDNRASKRNPRAPDFKCRDKGCEGAIWPPKAEGAQRGRGRTRAAAPAAGPLVPEQEDDEAYLDALAETGSDGLPF